MPLHILNGACIQYQLQADMFKRLVCQSVCLSVYLIQKRQTEYLRHAALGG